MAKTTQQMPVVRADARFTWAPPGTPAATQGSSVTPMDLAVALYSNQTVNLTAIKPYADIVTGLEWEDGSDAITSAGASWSSGATWEDNAKQHLLLKATNALRRQMGLPLDPRTPEWPGSE